MSDIRRSILETIGDTPLIELGRVRPPGSTRLLVKLEAFGDGLVPDILNRDVIDRFLTVTDEDAVATARRLAAEEGLFVGISSGTNVWAALKVAEDLGPGHTVVTVCPDTGERYLSMNIFGVAPHPHPV